MVNQNSIVNNINNNSKLTLEEKYFITYFLTKLENLKLKSFNLENFKNNVSDLEIKLLDREGFIPEDIIDKNTNSNNDQYNASVLSNYDYDKNIIYIHKDLVKNGDDLKSNNPNYSVDNELLKYHMFNRLLDCSSTKKINNDIKYGITNNGSNTCMNNMLKESILKQLVDGDYNNYGIEEIPYLKIQKLVDIDNLLLYYSNARYDLLKNELAQYSIELDQFGKRLDMLNNVVNNKYNDDIPGLMVSIEEPLISGYKQKVDSNTNQEDINEFNDLIFNKNMIEWYSMGHLNIYNGVENLNSVQSTISIKNK